MNRVWRYAPYEGDTLLTLLAMADWSDDSGVCWPSIKKIAEKTRQSERNAQYCLDRLKLAGAVALIEPGGGRGNPAKYRLNIEAFAPIRTEKGATSDSERVQSAQVKGAICDSVIRKEPPVDPPKEPSEKENPLTLPIGSDVLVEQIALSHPRYERPLETQREIVEQTERLAGRFGGRNEAARYLLKRTMLFAEKAAAWPRDEFRKSFPASPRWFRAGCFEEKESNWEWHDDANGKAQKYNRAADSIAAAADRLAARPDD